MLIEVNTFTVETVHCTGLNKIKLQQNTYINNINNCEPTLHMTAWDNFFVSKPLYSTDFIFVIITFISKQDTIKSNQYFNGNLI